jgi:hypothetical protein
MTLDELVSQLQSAYGASLRSVVLYGSAAGGDHAPKRSDYNVLVIVDDLDPAHLVAASATARAWNDAGNPAPLTMTTSEWHGSSDIFPMEYADILDRHRVLFGAAPFEGIHVDRKDLRLQVEQEAMGKLLKLRQGVLASGNDGGRQLELLAASVSSIMIVFRGVLRLQGAAVPARNGAVCEAVAKHVGFDAGPFEQVLRHVHGEAKLAGRDAGVVLAGYLKGMERLVAFVDTFQISQ